MRIQRLLFKVARSPIATFFIGWVFAHMSFAIPVNRLRETERLLAFYHPQPSYPLHILIVPKKAIPSVMHVREADGSFMVDLMQTVQSLVSELQLEARGYRLIVNGGEYQDVPQLHFHLISEHDG